MQTDPNMRFEKRIVEVPMKHVRAARLCGVHLRSGIALAAIALALTNPDLAFAAETALHEAAEAGSGTRASDIPADYDTTDDEPNNPNANVVDRSYDSVDDMVQSAVKAVDSFFVNSEHSTFSEKKTRIRFRLNSNYIQHHGWDISPKIKLNLVLPGLNDRLRLVVNDDQGADVDQAAPASDENDVALRWIGKQSKKRGYSFDLGLRIKSGTLDPFGRINLGFEYGLTDKWIGQTTNRLYYYSKTGLRNDFRQYFNRELTDDLLFRSRTRLQYFEENAYNPYIEQKFSLFHSIREGRMFAYEALYKRVSIEDSPFDEEEITDSESDHFNHYQLQIRFRQQAWRPWFYVEFWPIVAWPEERDYDTVLGARIRFEINLGGSGDRRLDE